LDFLTSDIHHTLVINCSTSVLNAYTSYDMVNASVAAT